MKLASRGLVRRQICQQHGSTTKLHELELLGVHRLDRSTAAAEFCENLASTITTARARKLHEVRMQQALEKLRILSGLETMQLGLQDPQTLKQIAAPHGCA